ncbi:hypothetical protein ACFXDE_04810 [Kitasatospora sp. NPDC059408]|uniref:hypothetical protein n=1 Tax=Kitasatospora sp. NPDC059408 TaxID=3346823 RepID=UPI00369FA216
MEFQRVVGSGDWRDPAKERRLYARARSPLGEVLLHRARATRGGVEGQWEGWEEWTVGIGGNDVLVLHDMGNPGGPALRRVAKTVHGEFAGAGMTVRGQRSLLPSGRSVVLSMAGGAIRFRTQGFRIQAVSARGDVVGERRGGVWDGVRAEADVVAAVCVFEWAGLDGFLGFPLLQYV